MSLKNLAKKIKQDIKDQSKTTEELLIESLDKFLIRSRSRWEEARSSRKAFNPSSVYKCQRQIWYKLKGFTGKKRMYARSVRILETGTVMHEWVQREVFMKMNEEEGTGIKLLPMEELPAFGKEGIEFITEHHAPPMEVKFLDRRHTEEIPVSAMTDGAFTFLQQDMLFEFKTINPDDFKLLIEPLKDHIKQGAVYSLCLEVKHVMFLYFNKGDQHWRAFLVEYTDDQHDWVRNRLTTIEGYVQRDELPPTEASDQCQWCPFKTLCDNNVQEKEPAS